MYHEDWDDGMVEAHFGFSHCTFSLSFYPPPSLSFCLLSLPSLFQLPSLILPSLILPSLFAYSTKKYSYSWWSTGPVTTSHSSSFPLFPPTHQTSRRQEHLCRVSWWVWRRHYRSHDTWDHLGHVPGGHFVSGNTASISDTYPPSQLQLWTHPNRSECKYTSSNSLLSDHKHLIS